MDLTESYGDYLPDAVRDRYKFAETRNAASILRVTNPFAFEEIMEALNDFSLHTDDLIVPGGQESNLAARLNSAFRSRGWREARVDTRIGLVLRLSPYVPAGETGFVEVETETLNTGYKVDNFRDRVALDVEWNAKDGNLDRDIGAYRALYDAALIDVGVIITRTQEDLRALGYKLGMEAGLGEERSKKILGTTTTTNSDKLLPRLTRGDGGGCPILAVFICANTYNP